MKPIAYIFGREGFIGSALSPALKAAGWDNPCGSRIDIRSFEAVQREIMFHRPDVVYHLAAQTEVGMANAAPLWTFETNAQGTWNILEACRQAKVPRVIIASSDKAYGDCKEIPYRESSSLVPAGPYETSKAMGDMAAQCYAKRYGMSIAIARCGNIYGPGQTNKTTVITASIERGLRGLAPLLHSDGTQRREFIYIKDAVTAYVKLAGQGRLGAHVGPINFGTGQPIRIYDLCRLIMRLLDVKAKLKRGPKTSMEIYEQYIDARLARSLGWAPAMPLEQGLACTIAWHKGLPS